MKPKKQQEVTKGSGNVFADLGFANSSEHRLKAHLVMRISEIINRVGMTQAAAAKRLGVDQPKVSAMLRGHFRGFSVYRLMSFYVSLGGTVEVVAKEPYRHRDDSVGQIVMR